MRKNKDQAAEKESIGMMLSGVLLLAPSCSSHVFVINAKEDGGSIPAVGSDVVYLGFNNSEAAVEGLNLASQRVEIILHFAAAALDFRVRDLDKSREVRDGFLQVSVLIPEPSDLGFQILDVRKNFRGWTVVPMRGFQVNNTTIVTHGVLPIPATTRLETTNGMLRRAPVILTLPHVKGSLASTITRFLRFGMPMTGELHQTTTRNLKFRATITLPLDHIKEITFHAYPPRVSLDMLSTSTTLQRRKTQTAVLHAKPEENNSKNFAE